jgi:hypothetical protein
VHLAPDMLENTCNLRTWETKARGSRV